MTSLPKLELAQLLVFSVMSQQMFLTLKQSIVYARFLVDAKPQTCFLNIVNVINDQAEMLERVLLEKCSTCEIPTSRVFSSESGGAAVMTVRRAAVAARLKAHNLEMISLHCGAHRVALASSQAAQEVPYLKTYDSHLTTMYYHFANSSVREASLHEVHAVMGEANPHSVVVPWSSR